jgi:multidrug resistance protein MdtO
MATLAPTLPDSPAASNWIREFLEEELAPYPGRTRVVARMVTAATVVMVLCMTFRIPYAFAGALCALIITRESARTTVRSSVLILASTVVSTAYVVVSAYAVINFPGFHFLWIMGSFFIGFYALSAMNDYIAAWMFAFVIGVTVPVWDRYVSAGTKVEASLWVALSATVGILITLAVELLVARGKPGDDIVLPVAERLLAVEEMLTQLAEEGVVNPASEKKLVRLAMRGTSLSRRLLRRSEYSRHYQAQLNAVVTIAGRLVDIAATPEDLAGQLSSGGRKKARDLAQKVRSIRADLWNRRIPGAISISASDETSHEFPLLQQMEGVVSLIPQAFTDSQSLDEYMPSLDGLPESKLLSADAFVSTRHAKFALKGCLAAGTCYVIYNAIDWQGLGTPAVITCFFTALSTIGSSRQKQILRLSGFVVGGFILGMGAQIFVLPHVASIFGFTILFIAVTALASWFATCTPRLSFFGLQVAISFYLIHLQEFAIQTSLAVARDRVVGVLLGLFIMWLVFDQLWGAPAAVEMKRGFVLNLRMLAQLAREPVSSDRRAAVTRCLSLRDILGEKLDTVRAFADAAVLEFGPSRQQDLAWRKRIQQWQPQLRTLFLTRMALLKYRLQLPNFVLPAEVLAAQQEFDGQSAKTLEAMADRIEGKSPPQKEGDLEQSFSHLERAAASAQQGVLAPRVRTLVVLSDRSRNLTRWLDENVGFPAS